MNESKRDYAIAATLLLALVSALIAYSLSSTGKDEKSIEAVDSSSPPPPRDKSGGGYSSSTPSQNGGASARDDYLCTLMKHLCIDDPLSAATEIEARWLQQFGYPSQRRLEELEHLPLSQLESLSEKGDLPARIVMGKQQIALGDHVKGRASITDALISGSTYAAYELARSNNVETPSSTKTDAIAYYRLAYLLGDWKASREMYSTQEADSLQMRMADERAMQLYRNILDERGRRRVGMRVWPRP